ncbi:hypothetical protein [Pseudoalteromonas sp. HF66]|uniref:hypothetical protein n=1 Tax=Pseudoalteromonas sp. HF66 TaxID=2721559 RepID=UPI00143182C3|nr:hypothetical protein [Pseudoalteromonas sp. HF66]NIZ06474.1 hypothetical protein [Pseudoalteromonas sp. HF66]
MSYVTVLLPCAEGSDRNCLGKVGADKYSDSYFDLSTEDQREIASLASQHTQEDGDFVYSFDDDEEEIRIEPAVCSYCGSDYYRNDDDEIIMD